MTAGDRGSCSQLGGALRTSAARLAECGAGLDGPDRQRALALAAELDAAGSRLQVHAQELAELAASTARLQVRVAAAGLHLRSLRVVGPPGSDDLPGAERRMQDRLDLQASAERLAARLGRSRAELLRCLREAAEELERMASAAAPPRACAGIH